jgi:small GTP-binding protein
MVHLNMMIVGDNAVGKTSMMLHITENRHEETYLATIGVEFRILTLYSDGIPVKVQIWDTTGQDRLRSLVSSYYRNCHAFMVVYDVTRRETFEHLDQWFGDINTYVLPEVPRILVGNKIDQRRKVSTLAGEEYAERLKIDFIETSVNLPLTVQEAFQTLVDRTVKSRNEKKSTDAIVLDTQYPPAQSGFCS